MSLRTGRPAPRSAHARWIRLGLPLLFFTATSTVYTYPLVLDLPRAGILGHGDLYGALGRIGAIAHQLLTQPLGLFDTHFFYPYSNTHAYWAPFWLAGLAAAPVVALTGNVVLATNLLLLLALVLSGVVAYRVALALTGRAVPSLLAGLVFAYGPNRMDHLGQLTVQMGFLLPLIVWAFYRFVLEGRWRHLLGLVLALWTQALLSLYYAYALGFLLVGFLVALLPLRPRLLSWSLVLKGAVGALLLGALLLPFLRPYWDVHRELGFERSVDLAEVASLDLFSVFSAGFFNRLYGRGPVKAGYALEGGLFPGLVALGLCGLAPWLIRREPPDARRQGWRVRARRLLGAAAVVCGAALLVVPWTGGVDLHVVSIRLLKVTRLTGPVALLPAFALGWLALERRADRRGPLTRREWTVALVFLAVFTYTLTLGPTLHALRRSWGDGLLWWWVYRYVPGGHGFGAPGRWGLLVALPVALLAALGAGGLAERLGGRRAVVVPVLLLAGVMAEYRDVLPWDSIGAPPPVYGWLARQPGDFAILELPISEGPAQAWYMFGATVHHKRLVNGELSFVPPIAIEIADLTSPLDLPALAQRLRSIYPLRYLVVHRGLLPAGEHMTWEAPRDDPRLGLHFVHRFELDDVYAVAATPDTGVVVRRDFSLDVVQRHPRATYDLRWVGEDPEVRRWVELDFDGRPVGTRETAGAGTVRLAPPYRRADRNQLRFVHRYAVLPAATRRAEYVIGRTGIHSPVDIEAASGGKYSGNVASIVVDGLERVTRPLRGYQVVAIEPGSGRVIANDHFDTYRSEGESRRMARTIEGLPAGTIVVAAVKHDGGGQLEAAAVRALRSIGAKADLRRTLWQSHLVVGVKGAGPGQAWEAVGARELHVSIGRRRPLALTLQAFALR